MSVIRNVVINCLARGNLRSLYLCGQLFGGANSDAAAGGFDIVAVCFDSCLTFDLTNEVRAAVLLQQLVEDCFVVLVACLNYRYVIFFGPRHSNNLLGLS